jgi:predicted enzyme related to lactoylglutathione lyase
MPRRTSYQPGTFCWVDLSTTDLDAAKRFYGELFGWDTRDQPMYAFFDLDGAVVAGLAELQPQQAQAGMPPSWSTYVCVADADAAAARARELGASVTAEPFDIPEAGRMGVIADPQGAILLVWQPAPFEGAEVVNEDGAWSWSDLQTPDPAVAAQFYAQLFGWQITPIAESGGMYSTIAAGERTIGGIMRAGDGAANPFWTTYIGVPSADAVVEQAQGSGGRLVFGPMDVPAGRFALVADPQGAVFGVVQGAYDD